MDRSSSNVFFSLRVGYSIVSEFISSFLSVINEKRLDNFSIF